MTTNSFNIPRHWWGKIIGGLIGLFRGGLAGILFDGEQYHIHIEPESAIFDYGSRPLRTDKSVEDYSRQAHLRGRQMAEAMVAIVLADHYLRWRGQTGTIDR